MTPIVSIGTQNFEKIRKNNSFYIDKTGFIKEWWENLDDVTLISRPRRFGKTLNLNMLNYFFSTEHAGRADLFDGLAIWTKENYRHIQGTYPVISLSFADVKGNTYYDIREGIIAVLSDCFKKHNYLLEKSALSKQEEAYFCSFYHYLLDNSPTKSMTDLSLIRALKELSFYLYRYYGKKVLIFLDEYDTPLQEAYVNGFWSELSIFIRRMFNSTFKTNDYMERAVLTGITRVSKESIFSDLNHLKVVTTTSDKYATAFGFTEREVFSALDQMGKTNELEKVKAWYNGFTFGKCTDIYNPWSITNYLDTGIFHPYWADTSSNRLVSDLILRSTAQLKIQMEDLLAKKAIVTPLDEQISFEQLEEKNRSIWSLLLACGYLKINRIMVDPVGKRNYCLEITNHETMLMFHNLIAAWFPEEDESFGNFKTALLMGDIDFMNQFMNEVAAATFSSFDTGKQPSDKTHPERFYHGFVLGLIVDLSNRYHITSNRESGFGRYDVIMEPKHSDDQAFIFEFKVFHPHKEKDLEETLHHALTQISEKKYEVDLIARGIAADRIRYYGFAFEGKKVLIGST
jgi:hypothetical protein